MIAKRRVLVRFETPRFDKIFDVPTRPDFFEMFIDALPETLESVHR